MHLKFAEFLASVISNFNPNGGELLARLYQYRCLHLPKVAIYICASTVIL